MRATRGRRRAAAVLGAFLLGGTACGAAPRGGDPVATSTSRTLDIAGEQRTFLLHRPPELPAAPALVVMLHGGGGTGRQAQRTYGWDAVADREGFLVAYPDGLGRTWNAGGGCCGRAARDDVDDVGFLLAMIDELVTAEDVDPARVFVTGMSNGAMMSYALACHTDVVAAIAPVAGTMLGECATPPPVSVLHVHGTADENVRFDGGPGAGAGRIDGPPVPSVIEHWRTVDACTPPRA